MSTTAFADGATMTGPAYESWAADMRVLAAERDPGDPGPPVPQIQDVAHNTGDSMSLLRSGGGATQQEIVFRGVHFMAETAKLLSPDRRVLLPDRAAGCFLGDSITAEQLRDWKAEHSGAVGRTHALIHADFPRLPNVGYVVAEQLSTPVTP